MNFRKTISILVIILIAATTLFSQANEIYDGPKPEVYAGAKSLVFLYTPFQSNLGAAPAGSVIMYDYEVITSSFGSITTLVFYEVQLGGVGFKYFVSDQISLTGSLYFGSKTDDWEDSYPYTNEWSGTTTTLIYKDEMSMSVFGLSLDADYHLKHLYNISPYIGLNINFASASAEGTYKEPNSNPLYEETLNFSGSAIGIGLNVGFDWYFTEGLSLGGKYMISYRGFSGPEFEFTKQEGSSSTTNKSEGKSISFIGTGVASIMLNVHF